jgi:hypothetical protein
MSDRYETMGEDLATLICLECSTRTTGVTIPADERDQHDGWHDAAVTSPDQQVRPVSLPHMWGDPQDA